MHKGAHGTRQLTSQAAEDPRMASRASMQRFLLALTSCRLLPGWRPFLQHIEKLDASSGMFLSLSPDHQSGRGDVEDK